MNSDKLRSFTCGAIYYRYFNKKPICFRLANGRSCEAGRLPKQICIGCGKPKPKPNPLPTPTPCDTTYWSSLYCAAPLGSVYSITQKDPSCIQTLANMLPSTCSAHRGRTLLGTGRIDSSIRAAYERWKNKKPSPGTGQGHANDGIAFLNKEGRLPKGKYTEWGVASYRGFTTSTQRNAARVVFDANGTGFVTYDHYQTFYMVMKKGEPMRRHVPVAKLDFTKLCRRGLAQCTGKLWISSTKWKATKFFWALIKKVELPLALFGQLAEQHRLYLSLDAIMKKEMQKARNRGQDENCVFYDAEC